MTQKIDYTKLATSYQEKFCSKCGGYKHISHFDKLGRCRFVLCEECGQMVDPRCHFKTGGCYVKNRNKKKTAWLAKDKKENPEKYRKHNRKSRGVEEVAVYCDNCEKKFTTTDYIARRNQFFFCHRECRAEYYAKPGYSKACCVCGETKHHSEYPKNKSRSDGLNNACRECAKQRVREYHAKKKKERDERASRR